MFRVDARKIRGLMFAQKLNISEVAEKANLHMFSVSRLLSDGATATAKTIGKLADALGCDGEEIVLKS